MRIWITRSQPGADRQAAALRARGHQPLVAPVMTISPIPAEPPSAAFTDVIFLSEHAVGLGVPRLTAAGWTPASMRIFAVGSATAACLADTGISARVPARASSEGLLAMDEFADPAGCRVLIVSGLGGRDLLVRELADRGARVTKFEVYRRQPVDGIDADLSGIEGISVASGDGFELMARLWFAAAGPDDVPVFVPSERVAALGEPLGFCRVFTCADAGTDALLDRLTAFTKNG